MAVLTDDLVARVLAAAEPAKRPLRRQMLDVLLAPAQPARRSYEEFLAWADEDTLAEWVDGEMILTSPASLRHQGISRFLAQIDGVYVEEHDLGALIVPPFQMRLASSGREPDLLFVAAEHLHRPRDTFLDHARQSPRPSLRSNRAIASNVRPAAAVANYARIAQPVV
jgi:hypothetical protein